MNSNHGFIPQNRHETIYFLFAILIVFAYFSSLPWSQEHSSRYFMDHFFGADVWRVMENLKDSADVTHYRDKVHPYFSLFAVTISKLGGLTSIAGAEFFIYRVVFGSLGCFLFWLFIYRESSVLISFSCLALLLSTMAVRVWSALPETFIFGFFTLMLAINLIRQKANPIAVFVVTFSGTITNAFMGVLYFWRNSKFDEDLIKKLGILVVVLGILSVLQKNIYPTSVSLFSFFWLNEGGYLGQSLSNIPFRAFDFIYSGFVLPSPETAIKPITSYELWRIFFEGGFTIIELRQTGFVLLSISLITLLLFYSLYAFLKKRENDDSRLIIIYFIAYQFVLHLVYGDTPFLYSYHFLPLLIIYMVLNLPKNIITPIMIILLSASLQEANFGNWARFSQAFN